MDRSSRRQESIEPSRQAELPTTPNTRPEPTTRDTTGSRPIPEDRTQAGNAGSGDRTVEERSTASAEVGGEAPASSKDDRQEGVADRSVARSAEDADDATEERGRDDAEKTAIARPSDDSTSAVRDASDRLPANVREEMLQDPVFTRLGWGVGDDADSDDDDDGVTPDEQVEVRTSEADDHTPLAQPDVDNGQHAAGGDLARTAAAERTHTDEPEADEQDVDPAHNVASGAAADVKVPAAELAADSGSPADAANRSAMDRDSYSAADESNASEDPASPSKSMAVDSETTGNGEALGEAAFGVLDEVEVPERDREPFRLDTVVDVEQVVDSVDRWDPVRAHVLDQTQGDALTAEAAVEYIHTMKSERPWLEPAVDCDPRIQHIMASLDIGNGHAHLRHGAMGNDALYERRAAFLEDPAQLDPLKRSVSVDGLRPGQIHRCAAEATRIHDATAFAVAVARAVEHPDVRAALEMPWVEGKRPDVVSIPISDLLGSEGHQYCSGFRLTGEWPTSRELRQQWVVARAGGHDLTGIPEPEAEPIPTFRDGDIVVAFRPDRERQRYEMTSMFADPPPRETTEGSSNA